MSLAKFRKITKLTNKPKTQDLSTPKKPSDKKDRK